MMRRPPRSPLFPYTPLFRSCWPGARRTRSTRPAASRTTAAAPTPGLAKTTKPQAAQVGRGRPPRVVRVSPPRRSEEHTSELQSLAYLVCRLLLEKKKNNHTRHYLAVRVYIIHSRILRSASVDLF